MKEIRIILLLALVASLALLGAAPAAQAVPFTFGPGQYDNTANNGPTTANGLSSLPNFTNNQTTGNFRDIIWGTNLLPNVDFINSGNSLVLSGNHAAPGPGPYTALNFTGIRFGSDGGTLLTIYDTTPADGNATTNTFAASGLKISADVLFVEFGHGVSAGVVALYSEGQDGLALLAKDNGNTDSKQLDLVFQRNGVGTLLDSVIIQNAGGFSTHPFDEAKWYNIEMDLTVDGAGNINVTGTFSKHLTETDPTSGLGDVVATLTHNGINLLLPGNALDLTNPGEVGLMAMTTESFSDGLATGGTGANPGVDNLGISFTNFDCPSTVPEPATMLLLGSGLIGLAGFARRRFKK